MFNQDMMRYLPLMQQFQQQQQGGGLLSPQDEKQPTSQFGGMGLLSLLGLPMGGAMSLLGLPMGGAMSLLGLPMGGAMELLKSKGMGVNGVGNGMQGYGDISAILKMLGGFNGTP